MDINATGVLKQYDTGGKKGKPDGKIDKGEILQQVKTPEGKAKFLKTISDSQKTLTQKINNPSTGIKDKNEALQQFFNNQQVLDNADFISKLNDLINNIDLDHIIDSKQFKESFDPMKCMVVM